MDAYGTSSAGSNMPSLKRVPSVRSSARSTSASVVSPRSMAVGWSCQKRRDPGWPGWIGVSFQPRPRDDRPTGRTRDGTMIRAVAADNEGLCRAKYRTAETWAYNYSHWAIYRPRRRLRSPGISHTARQCSFVISLYIFKSHKFQLPGLPQVTALYYRGAFPRVSHAPMRAVTAPGV